MGFPSFDEVKEVVDLQECPECHGGRLTLERVFHVIPPGTYSVAGQQMKLSAGEMWMAKCSSCEATFHVDGAQYAD